MSIQIASPSIVLNSDDWDILNYEMDETMVVRKGEDISKVIDKSALKCDALKSRSGRYVNMVINCHGKYRDGHGGYGLSLGDGIRRDNAHLFGKLSKSVGQIYVVACATAAVAETGGWGDGNLFCVAIARYARATVYASLDKQIGNSLVHEDKGYIDDWEGTVLTYAPNGDVIYTSRYEKPLLLGN
jgi:hypothetical protein